MLESHSRKLPVNWVLNHEEVFITVTFHRDDASLRRHRLWRRHAAGKE